MTREEALQEAQRRAVDLVIATLYPYGDRSELIYLPGKGWHTCKELSELIASRLEAAFADADKNPESGQYGKDR
jgi:hypothetical protein